MVKLQIALDFIQLADALKIADQVKDWVDWIEAGTPLIKAEGIRVVKILKERYPDKIIVADLKTADTGFLEAELAFQAGADVASVLAATANETIEGAVKAGKKYGKKIMADLIAVKDPAEKAKEIDKLGIDYVVVHTGIDQQVAGKDPFNTLEKIYNLNLNAKLVLVGGLNSTSIKRLVNYPKVDLVIVGGAITKADNPEFEAKTIRGVINEISKASHA